MKLLRIFEFKCPLCDGLNRDLEARKPTHHTPTVTKINCDGCDSRLVLHVSIPRDREKTTQMMIRLATFTPSVKLLMMMQEREDAEKAAAQAEAPKEEAVVPTP
jgi:hypothetical protein